jgi:hypothetical protein
MATELPVAGNQFSFVCPIFNVSTKMAACVKLRNLVYRGQGPDVRKGCQACMASNKCPAIHAINNTIRNKENSEFPYASPTPVEGKLRADILERIAPVVVQAAHLQKFAVPISEVALIETANDRIYKQLGVAPKQGGKTGGSRMPARKAKSENTPVQTSVQQAAATGDLTAAINAA